MKKTFDFENFVDLSFRLKDKDGEILNTIKVASIINDGKEPSIMDTGGNKFKYLLRTKKWHLIYKGLADEECLKEDIGYTLMPVEIGCPHHRPRRYDPFWLLPTNQKAPQ